MTCFFLDMGVIVGYASYIDNSPTTDLYAKPSVEFVKKFEKDEFITCHHIVDNDLPKFQKRRRILREEVRKKLRDPKYKIDSTELYPRDVERAEEICKLKDRLPGGEAEVFQLISEMDANFDARIRFFLDNKITKVVIPLSDIDAELRSHFFTFVRNWSDSNIIASAVQYNTGSTINVVTTDKKDFWKLKEWLDTDLHLSEKYSVPPISYIKDLV